MRLLEKDAPPPPIAQDRPRSSLDAGSEKWVRCGSCGHALARESDRVPLETTTFVNPAGVVFTLAAFREAPGCAVEGEPTSYWTWFPGHSWQFAFCGACGTHLGWAFSGASRFFGLLVERVRS